MKLLDPIHLLIIEPNAQLFSPYTSLPFSYEVSRVSSLDQAAASFLTLEPELIMISASFAPNAIITFLEKVKNESIEIDQLIPVIFVVDLSHQLNFIPGTTWGSQIGILHSLSSPPELYATLQRILELT